VILLKHYTMGKFAEFIETYDESIYYRLTEAELDLYDDLMVELNVQSDCEESIKILNMISFVIDDQDLSIKLHKTEFELDFLYEILNAMNIIAKQYEYIITSVIFD